jgi:hypothetical protein
MRNPVVGYVTICAHCMHEEYFTRQAAANAALAQHQRHHPGHAVRVTRVKNPGRGRRRQSA